KSPADEMQIYEFGKLPVAYQGRIKPYDTLARNSLQIISSRQGVGVLDEKDNVKETLPAIRWLLDAISGAEGAEDHRIFRIENTDLLDALELKHRPLFWRYSFKEITHKPASVPGNPEISSELQRQIKLAEDTAEKKR